MTPFGIRKRIKSLLGLGPKSEATPKAAPPERPKVTLVVVTPSGEEMSWTGKAGSTPVYLSGNMKRPIATGCNDSSCGTCRVEVLEGAENLSEQTARERNTLKENGFSETLRLGCRAEILKDTVKVKPAEFLVPG